MKLIIERDTFADAVASAMRASGRGPAIPILNNVLLKPNGSTIHITATSLDVQMQTTVAAEVDDTIEPFTVRADALAGIISQMPKGAQVSIETDAAKQSVIVKSGRSRYRLLTLPADSFPDELKVKEGVNFTMAGAELAAILSAVKFAVSKDRSRPVWQGIHVSVSTDEHVVFGGSKQRRLVFVALDGYELARASFQVPSGAEGMPEIILPDNAIPEIIRLATEASELRLEVSPALVTVSVGHTTFTTKLIDGVWPNYINGVPADNDMRMIVDADDLASAINRLRAIDDGSKHGTPMHIAIADGKLKLSLSNHLLGDAVEEIEVEWNAEPYEIDLRSKGLLNILDAINADVCVLRFGAVASAAGKRNSKPLIIQPWRNDTAIGDRTYFTMPMVGVVGSSDPAAA